MGKKHKNLNDYELISLIKNNQDELAFNELLRRYKYYIVRLANDMYLQNIGSGVTIQDLIAVCESTIYFSALKIKSEKSSFLAYWKLAANRHMIEYIKKNSYTSNAKMFAGVSLDEENKNIEDGLTFANIIGVEDKNHIDIHGIIDIVDGSDTFTSEERKTIHLFLFGYNFKEISQITHTSLSNVYVRYNSCVNKIREIIGK